MDASVDVRIRRIEKRGEGRVWGAAPPWPPLYLPDIVSVMARGFNSDNIMDFNKHVGYISELIPG